MLPLASTVKDQRPRRPWPGLVASAVKYSAAVGRTYPAASPSPAYKMQRRALFPAAPPSPHRHRGSPPCSLDHRSQEPEAVLALECFPVKVRPLAASPPAAPSTPSSPSQPPSRVELDELRKPQPWLPRGRRRLAPPMLEAAKPEPPRPPLSPHNLSFIFSGPCCRAASCRAWPASHGGQA